MNKVQIGDATLYLGDCLETLRGMADNSVDSIVTDPPYGLSFMGKKWDYDVPSVEVWTECLRVLKPGGHLLAFAGTRTQHRMAVRIEDAGFEIRDMIFWCYGSGFPKSLDVSKAIDKAAGAERLDALKGGHIGISAAGGDLSNENEIGNAVYHGIGKGAAMRGTPVTEAAKQWQGWGTALKPALEPITVARKPLVGTVAGNVLAHGTGGLNIDGCRVAGEPWASVAPNAGGRSGGVMGKASQHPGGEPHKAGRWPANLIHDGSDEVVAGFPVTTSGGGEKHPKSKSTFMASTDRDAYKGTSAGGDTGSAARFFYCAKASKRDRNEGLEGLPVRRGGAETFDKSNRDGLGEDRQPMNANVHPTVKPTDLMAYLCRLVTPPGGVVLDPFMGSGSTGKAAVLEGFAYIGCELDPSYIAISRARIEYALALRESGADKLHPASERDDKTVDLFS